MNSTRLPRLVLVAALCMLSSGLLSAQTVYNAEILSELDPAGNGSIARVTTDPDNYLSNAAFQTELNAAIAAGNGGVIFSGTADNQNDIIGLSGTYGLSDEKSINLSLSEEVEAFYATLGRLSADRPLGLTGGDTVTFTLTPQSGELIAQLGFTLDNRTSSGGSVTTNPTITVNFGDTSSVVLTQAINDGAINTDNVFFSVDGSANGGISSFTIAVPGGERGVGLDGVGFIAAPIPEPSTGLLICTGLAALAMSRRRRRC